MDQVPWSLSLQKHSEPSHLTKPRKHAWMQLISMCWPCISLTLALISSEYCQVPCVPISCPLPTNSIGRQSSLHENMLASPANLRVLKGNHSALAVLIFDCLQDLKVGDHCNTDIIRMLVLKGPASTKRAHENILAAG